MQSEETWMELHVLRRHGWSIAALAREFGLNWRTARRYATTDEAPRYRPRAEGPNALPWGVRCRHPRAEPWTAVSGAPRARVGDTMTSWCEDLAAPVAIAHHPAPIGL